MMLGVFFDQLKEITSHAKLSHENNVHAN